MQISQIKEASAYIQGKLTKMPEIGLILGSGLGDMANELENQVKIPYESIPHFPVSTVEGHMGNLIIGTFYGKSVIALQGRFHYYEGYTMQQVTFPVRVMQELGVTALILTNAAGGINESFKPGNLMIITDHINNMGTNPLIGPNEQTLGERFPDMSQVYNKAFVAHALASAKTLDIAVQTGVYVGNTGPTYETPAEIRMLRILGGDAVGMSTVPEAMVGAHAGMQILGISCISNMAAGILDQPLTHTEVIETTTLVKGHFIKLVKQIIETLPQNKV